MNTKIYLDMDGVIADFFGGLEKRFEVLHWKEISNIERALDTIKGTNFFYKLDQFIDYDADSSIKIYKSTELVRFVKSLAGDDWGICSSPLRGDSYNSAYWKRRWLEDNRMMPVVQNCIFTSNKEKYAMDKVTGTPNILIDDKKSNIMKWKAAGGVGIQYQANENDLFDYLLPEIEFQYNELQKG